jgi:hypothetical protein
MECWVGLYRNPVPTAVLTTAVFGFIYLRFLIRKHTGKSVALASRYPLLPNAGL